MKIWKTPKPVEYQYSLGTGCCNEMKANDTYFRVDDKGKVYLEAIPKYSKETHFGGHVYFDKCPFCGEPFETEGLSQDAFPKGI